MRLTPRHYDSPSPDKLSRPAATMADASAAIRPPRFVAAATTLAAIFVGACMPGGSGAPSARGSASKVSSKATSKPTEVAAVIQGVGSAGVAACSMSSAAAQLPPLIEQRWAMTGGPGGPLGCPTGTSGGAYTFQHGAIQVAATVGPNAAIAVYVQGTDIVVDWGDSSPQLYDSAQVTWTNTSLNKPVTTTGPKFNNGFSTRGIWYLPPPIAVGTYSISINTCSSTTNTCVTWPATPVTLPAPPQSPCDSSSPPVGGPNNNAAIVAEWNALGGSTGPLGCPRAADDTPSGDLFASPEGANPGTEAFIQYFEHGTIASTPNVAQGMTVAIWQEGFEPVVHIEWQNGNQSDFYHTITGFYKNLDGTGGDRFPQSGDFGGGTSGDVVYTAPDFGVFSIAIQGCTNGGFLQGANCPPFTVDIPFLVEPQKVFSNTCQVSLANVQADFPFSGFTDQDAAALAKMDLRWRELGGPDGPLGCPTVGEGGAPSTLAFGNATATPNDYLARFDHGQMEFAPEVGTSFMLSIWQSFDEIFVDFGTTFSGNAATADYFVLTATSPSGTSQSGFLLSSSLPQATGREPIAAVNGLNNGRAPFALIGQVPLPFAGTTCADVQSGALAETGDVITPLVLDRLQPGSQPGTFQIPNFLVGPAILTPNFQDGASYSFSVTPMYCDGTTEPFAFPASGSLDNAPGPSVVFHKAQATLPADFNPVFTNSASWIAQDDAQPDPFEARTQDALLNAACQEPLAGLHGDEQNWGFRATAMLELYARGTERCPDSPTDFRTMVNEAIRNIGEDPSVDMLGTTCNGRNGEYDVALFGLLRVYERYGALLDEDVKRHMENDLFVEKGPLDANDFAVNCQVVPGIVSTLIAVFGGPIGLVLDTDLVNFEAGISQPPLAASTPELPLAFNQEAEIPQPKYFNNVVSALASNISNSFVNSPETENHINSAESARYLTNQILYEKTGHLVYDNEANGMNLWWLLRLQRYLQNDFWEYNSKTYQSYMDKGLENLAEFAKDRRVRMGAQLALDLVSAKFAVSSNYLRRFPPYRRHVSDYDPSFLCVISPSDSACHIDQETGRFLTLTGLSSRLPGGTGDMVEAAVSSYRPPAAITDLITDPTHKTFYQRMSHYTVETYSSTPQYLITGGAEPTPAEEEVFVNINLGPVNLDSQCVGCDDEGSAVPITLMPSNEIVQTLDDVIHFDGLDGSLTDFAGSGSKLNHAHGQCVGPNFACGINPVIPAKYLRSTTTSAATVTQPAVSPCLVVGKVTGHPPSDPTKTVTGTFTFIDTSAADQCQFAAPIGVPGVTNPGYYVAMFTADNATPTNGFFEVLPEGSGQTFQSFWSNVLKNNSDAGQLVLDPNAISAPRTYRRADGVTTLNFSWQYTTTTFPQDSTGGYLPITWPFTNLGSPALNAFGTVPSTWPLYFGDVMNSGPGKNGARGSGLVTFRNPAGPVAINGGAGGPDIVVLDFSDFGEPNEVLSTSTSAQSQTQATLSLGVLTDWTVSNGSAALVPTSPDGLGSLDVTGDSYVTITSKPVSSADIRKNAGPNLSTLSFQLFIPTPQPNPSWIGNVQVYISSPTAGVYNAYVGQVMLTGQQIGAYNTERFTIPASALPALQGNFTDVTITIALNVNQATPGWLLSNLSFG